MSCKEALSRFHCPICQAAVERHGADFPFCSERCRIIDLGSWADGSYAIPGDPATVPEDEPWNEGAVGHE